MNQLIPSCWNTLQSMSLPRSESIKVIIIGKGIPIVYFLFQQKPNEHMSKSNFIWFLINNINFKYKICRTNMINETNSPQINSKTKYCTKV